MSIASQQSQDPPGYEDATTGQFDFNNLEQLANDTAFIAWEADRVAAYADESANQPAWCSDPLVTFSQWYASLSSSQ